jgi:hypothetical protein
MASSIARVAGLAAAIGLAGTAAFQLLLALDHMAEGPGTLTGVKASRADANGLV